MSDACACGTLRASASSSAIVCSAAVITFDCGRVRHDHAALGGRLDVDVVHPHPRAADDLQALGPLDQVGVELRGRADQRSRRTRRCGARARPGPSRSPSSTSKPGVAQQLHAGVADLLLDEDLRDALTRATGDARVGEDALRGRHARARLDLVAELPQRHLERRDRHDDVERAEVAAVGDAGDLALQLALPARDRDAELVAHQLRDLAAVDRVRKDRSRSRRWRPRRRRRSSSRSSALRRLARGAAEQRVARRRPPRGPPPRSSRAPRRAPARGRPPA